MAIHGVMPFSTAQSVVGKLDNIITEETRVCKAHYPARCWRTSSQAEFLTFTFFPSSATILLVAWSAQRRRHCSSALLRRVPRYLPMGVSTANVSSLTKRAKSTIKSKSLLYSMMKAISGAQIFYEKLKR